MKHLGDITKINGAEVPPVNVIIGGSPCQDLSVAGKRAGLAGERSGLFMEQIRIIKEMRKADADRGRTGKDIRPRYMVWENVPGAFSSNKGADFGAVLQETVKVIDGQASAVPMPVKGWPLAGCLYGDGGGFSISWRVFDAQFWGVPQRRRRIALVADFGGITAPEILFERESVSGDFETSGEQGQGTAGSPEESSGNTVRCLTPWDCQSKRVFDPDGAFNTLSAMGDSGANNQAICIQGNCIDRADTAGCNGRGWTEDVSYTLNTIDRPAVLPVAPVSFTNRGADGNGATETLRAQSHGAIPMVAENHALNPWDSQSARIYPDNGVWHSLSANEGGGQSRDAVLTDCYPDVAKNQGGIAIVQPLTYPDIANTLTSRNDGSPQPEKGNGASIIAFAQNQRDEVRDLNGKAGALAAETGMKQQTYIADVYAIGNGQADQTGLHEVAGTLNCMHDQQALLFENHGQDSRITGPLEVSPTVSRKYGTGGNNTPIVCEEQEAFGIDRAVFNQGANALYRPAIEKELQPTLTAKGPGAVAAVDCRNATESDINGTMQAKANGGFSCNCNQIVRSGYAVRRLTPTECERLQGFPDGWTDIGEWRTIKKKVPIYLPDDNNAPTWESFQSLNPDDESWDEEYDTQQEAYEDALNAYRAKRIDHYEYAEETCRWWKDDNGKLRHTSDALRYKVLGNSIALPSWCYVLQRLSICCGTDITMASLFDGIGGFPLIWEYLNGKGSCIWASEIEAFPIAVTRKHFPETK